MASTEAYESMLNILRALARFLGVRRPFKLALEEKAQSVRADLPFVLIVSHEASRTGAPILALNLCQQLKGRYNVIAMLLGTGELVQAFRDASDVLVGPYAAASVNPVLAERTINALCAKIPIQFAIVNSIASRSVLRPLSMHFLPTVFLVHEFFRFHCSAEEMTAAIGWAGSTVFAADLVRKSAALERLQMAMRAAHILPQGKCQIPSKGNTAAGDRTLRSVRNLLRNRPAKTFLVLGAGTIEYRKGVDLFVATAAQLERVRPDAQVLMVWIGKVVPSYQQYAKFVDEQIQQAAVEERIVLLDETENLEELYALAHACFISCRLDPLPNIGIDAMSAGVPILCFEKATGFAEILSANAITKSCVLPFLDVDAAAQAILKLVDDEAYRMQLSGVVKAIASEQFDMQNYVLQLEAIAQGDVPVMKQMQEDVRRLNQLPLFQPEIFLTTDIGLQREPAVLQFAKFCQSKVFLRKPSPGFYANRFVATEAANSIPENPLLAFWSRQCPAGPWQIPVIDVSTPCAQSIQALRIAVHVHVYYPDLLEPILRELGKQLPQCDLLLSVPNEAVEARVRAVSRGWLGKATIRIVPNRGRDIGPFLTEFGSDLSQYDVVGHLHTKKSVHAGSNLVSEWVTFLAENLIGGKYSAACRIMAEFAAAPALGLVFPDDPNVIGWDKNFAFAADLGSRLSLDALPEGPFPFPVGTMFWARPAALRPLLELKLNWDEYPQEPLPIDGTMLHAIERLLPRVVEKAGFSFAVTHAPGIRR